ncbi:izumo sperm-egg fusion protein 1 [Scleropages formosus]|uniref:izumo sperm-egg fusion protein 1 n=1 Tax=Scleropages formosus TaxID=113540 RepID=UPI00087900C4|nr:izumo sperm-egg fusion protein 1 [Scleropages formosus]
MARARCVFLVCAALLLSLASACLQCDKLIRYLLEDIALSAPLENQIRLNTVLNGAYKIYEDISRQYQGVIDFTTLYRARTQFQSEIAKYLASNPTDEEEVFFAIRLLQQGETILKNHLEEFVRTGLCPNTCGVFNQSVINCASCGNELHPCASPVDQRSCGVLQLEAEQDSQVVLNCFLPWHSLVVEEKEYHFSRSSDLSGEFTAFLVTPQSKVILNQLEMDERGVYRCLLQDGSGTVLTEMYYNLTGDGLQGKVDPARALR